MIKLDPVLKQQWVDALRSGKYVQAEGRLYEKTEGDIHHMCCLGVFEHICGTSLEELSNKSLYSSSIGMPNELSKRKTPVGVMRQRLSPSNMTLETYLANMNDGGKTFEDIATYIDENL